VNRARFICPSFKGRTLNPRGGKSQWQVTSSGSLIAHSIARISEKLIIHERFNFMKYNARVEKWRDKLEGQAFSEGLAPRGSVQTGKTLIHGPETKIEAHKN
jgi:hypothetical protein